MTIFKQYYNYQTAGTQHASYGKGAWPATKQLRDYVTKRYGGMDLGIYGIRPVRGGSVPSTHASGAAWDWRYENPGPGRVVAVNDVMPFLVDHSGELGIQMIMDYKGGRVWKSDRAGEEWDQRWMPQKSSSTGMGQEWAGWLHIELHPSVLTDIRSIEEKLGVGGDTPIFPPFNPEAGQFSLFPLVPFGTEPKVAIKIGARGDVVRYLQGALKKGGFAIPVDGNFGEITDQFVRFFQHLAGLTADGVVGPKTWAAVDAAAVK